MSLLALLAGQSAPDPYPAPTPGTLTIQPTYEGSGKTIHPSVLDMGGDFHGYRWYMADTPYPDQDDQYENPSIWASNDRINWVVPEGVTNPLVPRPPYGFNFDTELVWNPETQQMICYWRFDDGLRAATSPNGHDWTVLPNPVTSTAVGGTAVGGASEAIIREGPNDWRMWLMRPSGADMKEWHATDPLGVWTHVRNIDVPNLNPNHGDIIKHQDIYMAVVYSDFDPGPAYPMASLDGITWVTGQQIPGISVYRTTLLPSTVFGYLDVWYSNVSTQRVTYTRLPTSLFQNLLD